MWLPLIVLPFTSPTSLTTILNFFPTLRPFFSPTKGPRAYTANFFRKKLLLHLTEIKGDLKYQNYVGFTPLLKNFIRLPFSSIIYLQKFHDGRVLFQPFNSGLESHS